MLPSTYNKGIEKEFCIRVFTKGETDARYEDYTMRLMTNPRVTFTEVSPRVQLYSSGPRG